MSTLIEPQKGFIFTPNQTTPRGILDPAYRSLGEGIHNIIVFWDGPEALRVTRAPSATASLRRDIGRVKAGVGLRHTMIMGVDVRPGEKCYLSLIQASGFAPESSRASMIVFSTPLTA